MKTFKKLAVLAVVSVPGAALRAETPKAMIVLSSAAYNTGGNDAAYAVTAPNEDIFVTGSSGNDYVSLKYSKTLVQGAFQIYTNGLSGNSPGGIAVDGMGNIVVAGKTMNASNNFDYFAIKYNPNLGPMISSSVFNSGQYDEAAAVAVDGQSNIFVTGYSNNGTSKGFYTIKYGADFNKLSTATYDSVGDDGATAAAVDNSGNAIVAGYIKPAATEDFMVQKYDNNLSTPALYSISFPATGNEERATGVAVDSNNNIIVTGRQSDGVTQNYCTVKYDSFLNLISSRVYDGGADEIPTGVAVDSLDNIIVTGFSGSVPDYFTIKYDKNFVVLSSAVYNGGNSDRANAVAVDANDNVIVTGVSYNTNNDYFTIKYNASPKITEVSPLYIGETAFVTLKGNGFVADSAVSFADTGISTGTILFLSGQLTVAATVSPAVLLGVTTVTVANVNGESATNSSLAYTRLRRSVTAGQAETINAQTKAGQVTVTLPAAAFTQNQTATIYTAPATPGDLRQVGEALYVDVNPSSSSLVNISVKLRYLVSDLGGYRENSLSMAYYDVVGSSWVNVASSVNTLEKSVTGKSVKLNVKYAVVKAGSGIPVPGGLGGAKVYPNPYRPGSGGDFDQPDLGDGVVFAGFEAYEAFKLTIVDLAGQLVYQKSVAADNSGKYLWDTGTVSGGQAASGVYIYMIKGTGEPKKGKLSIIR